MTKYVIEGGHELSGRIRVAGNKNAVLPIMAASLLIDGPVELTNVPRILDVEVMGELLKSLGCKVEGLGTQRLQIDSSEVLNWELPDELVAKLRASVLLMGPVLSRFGKFRMRHPGGDIIGRRAIGTHFDVVRAMRGEVLIEDMHYRGELSSRGGKGENKETVIFLDEKSVTATENALMLAVKKPGTTIIENAAAEPHVQELAAFLNEAGGQIEGRGTNTLVVKGVSFLEGVKHEICPDNIEAGTFAMLGAMLAPKKLKIYPVRAVDIKTVLLYLQRMGVDIQVQNPKSKVQNLVVGKSKLKPPASDSGTYCRFQTQPWPGFPTDLMSPFIVLVTQSRGVTLCHDWMYEGRMFFVDKLISMGANITVCDPHRVLVYGPTELKGRKLASPDIRAGIALVIAALIARGESEIENVELIERGYENLVERLVGIGARLKKVA